MIPKLCIWLLSLAGWSLDTRLQPTEKRYVLIGYPHTSNWDFILAMLAKGALQLRFHFVAKHSLFKGPLGPLMRALGGISIDRDHSSGFTAALADKVRQHDEIILGMMPEGTRSHRPYWRSGFYHLARAAEIPIVMAYIDGKNRRIGFGPTLYPSSNQAADLAKLCDFYSNIAGIRPEKAGTIAFKNQ